MPFSLYYACIVCFLWSGCLSSDKNIDPNINTSKDDISKETSSKKDSLYKDDKLTLHIKNATPDQVALFTEQYKNFAAETYLFFQPHVHQIVLEGQDPDWIPISDGRYCIDQAYEVPRKHMEEVVEMQPAQDVKIELPSSKRNTNEHTTMSLVLSYANHCKKTSVLIREFTDVLKTYVHPENSCSLICGCAIRKGEMASKHDSIRTGDQSTCVDSCNETKNKCLTSCSKRNDLSRSKCEDNCRDISQSSFCDSKLSCCSLNQ